MDKSYLQVNNIVKLQTCISVADSMGIYCCNFFARIKSKIKVNNKILYTLQFLEGLDNNNNFSCHPNDIKKTHKDDIIFNSFFEVRRYTPNKNLEITYEEKIKMCKISKKLRNKYNLFVKKQLKKKIDITIKRILLLKKYFRLWNKMNKINKRFANIFKMNYELESKLLENHIPEDLICPISKEPFKNPVILASKRKNEFGGNTYEKKFITKWLKNGKNTEPLTGMQITHPILIKNMTVYKHINSLKDELKIKLDKQCVKPSILFKK